MLRRVYPLLLFAACGTANEAPALLPGVGADTLRVMAYNVHHGEGMDSILDLDRLADRITAEQPDLVALQEIDVGVQRTGRVDQARALGERTEMTPVFGAFMPYQGGEYGMAVLSRWPIVETRNLRLPDGDEPRTALAVRVRSPRTRQELIFVSIHFYRTDAERLAQARRLVALLDSETVPIILAGDYNSLPESEVMSFFRERWTVVDKGEDRFTFPSWAPAREIDYLVYRPAERFRVLEQRVLDEPVASDHRPLFMRVILTP